MELKNHLINHDTKDAPPIDEMLVDNLCHATFISVKKALFS
jgi:hypothetical protein